MAYDEYLVDRITRILEEKKVAFKPKKMMGGLTFMVDDKMCVGIFRNKLIVRINPNERVTLLEMEGVDEMQMTKRSMKSFLEIASEAIDNDSDLAFWIQKCLDFNPLAKASKKKKKT